MLAMSGLLASALPPGSTLFMNPRPHVGQDEPCAVETGGCEFSVFGAAELDGGTIARVIAVGGGAVVIVV